MSLQSLLPGIIGSFVGVMGWLLVGMYIQRRQFVRQARNAGKAIYFELGTNRVAISVARDHGTFHRLDRSSFERLLPELATILSVSDLEAVVDAYMTHAGYAQLASDTELPAGIRHQALAGMVSAHARAMEMLRNQVFSRTEVGLLRPDELTGGSTQ
jgi:hypothetical protein